MNNTVQQQVIEILEEIEDSFREHKPLDLVLDRLMDDLGGRAIGLWRCEQDRLLQVGFRAVSEMDEHVRKQFASFTEEVSLDNTGLGIVKAVMENEPAIGNLQGEQSGLTGSSKWLKKFEALQSYAVPIVTDIQVVGVIAISTNCIHQVGDVEWEVMRKIAEGIGKKKLLGML